MKKKAKKQSVAGYYFNRLKIKENISMGVGMCHSIPEYLHL